MLTRCFGGLGCHCYSYVKCSGISQEDICDPQTDRKESPKYYTRVAEAIENRNSTTVANMAKIGVTAGDLENDDCSSLRKIVSSRRALGLKATPKMAHFLQEHGVQIGTLYKFTPDVDLYVLVNAKSRNESAALECLIKTL